MPAARTRRLALNCAIVGAAWVLGTAAAEPAFAKPTVGVEDTLLVVPDSLRGLSGAIRFMALKPDRTAPEQLESLLDLFGLDALSSPGIHRVMDPVSKEPFSFASLVPFTEKQDGKVGVYRVGRWPAEVRRPRSEAYRLPAGFIEVTEENQHTQVSTHFTLGQFLTKDQRDVWPKMLLLDERLVDKLELIIVELRLAGHKAPGLNVLSGFRTPQYNARGKNSGRATDSRHQYGDAADVFVDADGNGKMDDLNGDKRIDTKDALAFVRIVEKVEQKYPSLVGGVGLYRAVPGHGPFVHVDARGERIRWGIP
ncbi:MAG: DUF882 domain-containing protein [Gemmatimonadaceae bacterium]|nr:DUF882 domain-containing protein [Gemmatimonadaceae bacterium]